MDYITLTEADQLIPLMVFMIIGSIVALEIKDMLSSVIAIGAVGVGVTISFLILKAPDLAITQLVVEILCLILLVRATIKREMYFPRKHVDYLRIISALVLILVFLGFSYAALRGLPQFGMPIMRVASEYISRGIRETGATNMVAAIILDYRGYDTLIEASILFTAVLGVSVVLRAVGRIKNEKS
jgi:multisubunit Na+/H+ antiporter MnhB subunit